MEENKIRKILKNVILSSALEPIPEKKGCTTRSLDFQDTSKLEYFIIAGINIGWDFYDLAMRIKNNDYKQPKVIYDISLKAQENSFKNRKGGKIDFGIIELFVPIITSQLVYGKGPIETLELATSILQNTSREDVEWHHKFRLLAKSRAKMFPNTILYEVSNMFEYYKLSKNELEDNVHKEYINGFTRIKKVYEIIIENLNEKNLLDATVVAYDYILPECLNYPGLAADYICIAIYLYLTFNEDSIII